MKKFRRVMAVLLVIQLLLTYLPADSHALHTHNTITGQRPDFSAPGSMRNPLYVSHGDEAGNRITAHRVNTASATKDDIRYTLLDAASELRQGMISREGEIAITYPADASFDADMIWEMALSETEDPKAGDYLRWQWGALSWQPYMDTIDGKNYYTMVFYPEYYTTAEQEAEVDSAVASLLAQLNLNGKTNYEKIKTIYDWVCSNVTYDYDNLNVSSYTLKYTAYAALIHNKSVCQGYALLIYRLCREVGISSRFISGTANNGAHGWNIVQIDYLYYNIDATWDAAAVQAGVDYRYFLRGNENFTDHVPDADYSDDVFMSNYMIDKHDYGYEITWPLTGTCGENLTWSLSENHALTISGTGDMYDYYSENPGWYDYAWQIQSITIEAGVTSVGAFAFNYADQVKQLTILGNAAIREYAFSGLANVQKLDLSRVTYIGDCAFQSAATLKELIIGPNVAHIGQKAFDQCINLETITVDPGNAKYTSVNNVLFSKDMTQLLCTSSNINASYVVPETVTMLHPYAFANSREVLSVSLPAGLKEIPEGTFSWCTRLRHVDIPSSVTKIGDMAFAYCSDLEGIQLPESLTQIGYGAFEMCSSLNTVSIPANTTFIAERAFASCNHLEMVRFEGAAPEIADDSFFGVFADAYYPSDSSTWTYDKLSDYGGYLNWIRYSEEHDYASQIVPPTCTEQGYTLYKCNHCGHTYKNSYVAPIGHSYGDWVIETAPTCTEPGVQTKKCAHCGDYYAEAIQPPGHQYSTAVTPPSCTEQGYTTYTCSVCGHSYKNNFVAQTGHKWDAGVVVTEPTEEQEGARKVTCTVCTETKTEPIPKLEHVHSYTTAVTQPTCTEDGFTTYTCRCGNTYRDNIVAALGHNYGQWQDAVLPSCTTSGEQYRPCSRCGDRQTQAVPARGHSYKNYIPDGNATCTQDGSKTAICDHGCGAKDTIADPGSKLGHDMGQWKTIKEPTFEQDGLERRSCSRCDHFEEQSIPVLEGPSHVTSERYEIQDGMITKIGPNTTIADFLEGIAEAEYVWIYKDGLEVTADDLISTGMELHLIVGNKTVQTLTLVVTGDTNGDGKISITDMLAIKAHLLSKSSLEGHQFLAGDMNKDGKLSITDFIQVKSHLLGKSAITG